MVCRSIFFVKSTIITSRLTRLLTVMGLYTMSKKNKLQKTWTQKMATYNNVVDFESRILTSHNPKDIAQSICDSTINNKKNPHLQAAMSTINFYINRAGRNLSTEQKHVLVEAKEELRTIFKQKRNQNR